MTVYHCTYIHVPVVFVCCACTCSLSEKEHQDLAPTMNAVVLHSRLVDSFDEVMVEYSDMSFLW